MMNCEQFRELLPDLARDVTAGGRDELLDAGAVKEALEHADACGSCDELLEEAESVTSSLRAMAAADSERQAPARVEKNLLRVLEVRRSLAMHSSYQRRFMLAGAAGVAAVALLGISLVWRAGTPAVVSDGSRTFGQRHTRGSIRLVVGVWRRGKNDEFVRSLIADLRSRVGGRRYGGAGGAITRGPG